MNIERLKTAAAVLLALAWTALAFSAGRLVEAAKGAAEVATLKSQYSDRLAEAQSAVMHAGEQLTTQLAERDTIHRKEIADVEQVAQQRAAALMSGRIRVSVPVASCTPTPVTIGTSAVTDGETRAELASETAAALDRIASDGDSAILDLNACIDQYNTVRNALLGLNHAQTP
jgi:hypothetical protein